MAEVRRQDQSKAWNTPIPRSTRSSGTRRGVHGPTAWLRERVQLGKLRQREDRHEQTRIQVSARAVQVSFTLKHAVQCSCSGMSAAVRAQAKQQHPQVLSKGWLGPCMAFMTTWIRHTPHGRWTIVVRKDIWEDDSRTPPPETSSNGNADEEGWKLLWDISGWTSAQLGRFTIEASTVANGMAYWKRIMINHVDDHRSKLRPPAPDMDGRMDWNGAWRSITP
ncbi:MAG: hypothetical protein M1823_006218 [Watsoniomyces obsoletus]|nr:MAG: hypothetical protein M1823_006218 [Watsoniomyces obsoletus]